MTPAERLERYAELAIRVGANVQPGQLVNVVGLVEHAPLARAIAAASYRAGARFVDVSYRDGHVRRARIEHAPEETLSMTPPWLLTRERELARERGAAVGITGDPEPELLADLPGDRVGKTRMVELAEASMKTVNERIVNWTGVAFPNEGWARAVFGEANLNREIPVALDEAIGAVQRINHPDARLSETPFCIDHSI